MGKSYAISPADAITYTVSATNEDAAYPDGNLLDREPGSPFKATTTATTISLTHASLARKIIAVINPSVLAGASTYTAGGVAVTCPARTADGQAVNHYRVLDLGASTTTSVVISGASANVGIGELVLGSALTDLNWTWGSSAPGITESHTWPTRGPGKTFYGSDLFYNAGTRTRRASGQMRRQADRATWLALAQASQGRNIPFVFIPDIDVNDCWYVRFSEDTLTALRRYNNATDVTITLEEVANGLPL